MLGPQGWEGRGVGGAGSVHSCGQRGHARHQPVLPQQRDRPRRMCVAQHQSQLLADALAGYLLLQRGMHSPAGARLGGLLCYAESQSAGETHHPQGSEGIVRESDQGRQGGTYYTQREVPNSPIREVFDLAGVDVVEQRVDGEISSQRVFFRRADLHLGNAGIGRVGLGPHIYEVHLKVAEFRRNRLEMLGFIGVHLDYAHLEDSPLQGRPLG
mmetsp:Transcript_27191/g.60179  ORF Transcript_27191/g.60179 Transcript_27191/m.60179 type:complete len:213 (+) Transcript_27191:191-829(+)